MVQYLTMKEEKNRRKIFLTLDLEKDYGTALNKDFFYALGNSEELITFLKKNDIPLTVFIQTKILEKKLLPDCFLSKNIQIEFCVHSYSHEIRNQISFVQEIKKSTSIFQDYFDVSPKGYRAPDGVIYRSDLELLKKYGYDYDSSIFPTWRPGRFNNLRTSKKPFILRNAIFEIPFSIYNLGLPIPITLSYLKILGNPFLKLCLNGKLPENIIFDFHLHDLTPPIKSYQNLPIFYKLIYKRNFLEGFKIFKKFVLFHKTKGTIFETLNHYYNELKYIRDKKE